MTHCLIKSDCINSTYINRRKIQRLPDWEPRLIQWLQKAAVTPFQWGEFDCALAAADALEAQTGHNFAGSWRGQYSTAAGSLKQLLKRGYRDVYEALGDALQVEAVEPHCLQRGDIAGVDLGDGRTENCSCVSSTSTVRGSRSLGVVWSGSVWLPEPDGLRAFPMSLVECGWRLSWAS